MYDYHGKNPSPAMDEELNKKIAAIVLSVLLVVILLLRLLCVWIHKDSDEEEDVVAGAGNRVRVHHRRQIRQSRGWADRAPSPTEDGVAVEEVSPVRAAEPPLVCTYRKADGWREGSCGVCLAELDDGDFLWVLPVCLHYFHAACVGEWLRGHNTCPLCRAPLIGPAAAAA